MKTIELRKLGDKIGKVLQNCGSGDEVKRLEFLLGILY